MNKFICFIKNLKTFSFLDNLCYPIGYRVGGDYCEITGLFVSQSAQGVCNNHFECSSNLCVDGACIEPGFFQRLIQWFRGLFS